MNDVHIGCDASLISEMHDVREKKRRYHHGDLKAAMIAAALELVRSKGARGFTLNEASRTAGVSVSAPYNHFKDKEALLIEIVLLGNRTLKTELEAAAERCESDRDKLLAVYLAYIAFSQRHPDLFAVMFQSGIDKEPYPEVKASAEEAFQVGLEIASRLETSVEKATELALAIWMMAHGFSMLIAEHAIDRVAGPTAEETARLLVNRLL